MSVSLHCNIGPIYRTRISKWKITLQSTHKWELQSYGRLRDGHPIVGVTIIWKVKGWTSTNRYIHNTPHWMSIKNMPH